MKCLRKTAQLLQSLISYFSLPNIRLISQQFAMFVVQAQDFLINSKEQIISISLQIPYECIWLNIEQ